MIMNAVFPYRSASIDSGGSIGGAADDAMMSQQADKSIGWSLL